LVAGALCTGVGGGRSVCLGFGPWVGHRRGERGACRSVCWNSVSIHIGVDWVVWGRRGPLLIYPVSIRLWD